MFDFGANWQDYSVHAADLGTVEAAEKSLCELLQVDNLAGQYVLDLGCGSGLFSIAAVRLGAQVTAADVNPLCIQVTEQNAARFLENSGALNIRRLSALDKEALSACGLFDIVYSWGVLHHTGSMWQ